VSFAVPAGFVCFALSFGAPERFQPDRTDQMVLKTHWLLVLASIFIIGLPPFKVILP
jgi:hypothetical protein